MRHLLAGESHGPALVGVVEGLPAGLALAPDFVRAEMARRREGHGRGPRARGVEDDEVRFLAGLADGVTLGSPLAFVIENRGLAARGRGSPQGWTVPRPGHADYAGLVKYGYTECGPAAERASGRATAGLVAVGACAKALLREFGIEVLSHVLAIGGVTAAAGAPTAARLRRIRAGTPVRCLDARAAAAMVAAIDAARADGTTLGGCFEVVAFGLPVGLGSCAQPDTRLDAWLAADVMAIPGVKAVAIGDGLEVAARPGHEAHDEFWPAPGARRRGGAGGRVAPARGPAAVARATNRAGGIEAGVTNGQPVRVRGWCKPLPTLRRGLRSVDLVTGRAESAPWVRSDTCVVPAAGVVGEAVVAWRLACALVEALGGSRLDVMRERWRALAPGRGGRPARAAPARRGR